MMFIAIDDFQRALLAHIIATEIVHVGHEMRCHDAEKRENIVAHCKREIASLRDVLDKVEKRGIDPYNSRGV